MGYEGKHKILIPPVSGWAGHARQPGQPKVAAAAAAALSNSSGRKKLKFWRSSLKN